MDGDIEAKAEATELWGLDRINQELLPLDGKELAVQDAGSGTTVYVVDSGVRCSHDEFVSCAHLLLLLESISITYFR